MDLSTAPRPLIPQLCAFAQDTTCTAVYSRPVLLSHQGTVLIALPGIVFNPHHDPIRENLLVAPSYR